MSAPTNTQIINGMDGQPAFVVIPYTNYLRQYQHEHYFNSE